MVFLIIKSTPQGTATMTVLPTTDQLALLDTAAKANGKASVHTSEVFRAAGCKQSDDVKQASRARDGLYREMDAIRDGLNERFPGLALACPAPYVGFTADVAGYEEYVARRLSDYVSELWTERNKAEITAIREIVRTTPETESYGIDDLLLCESALYRVTSVSPKRRKVSAMSVTSGKTTQLKGAQKRIDQPTAERMLALHAAHLRALHDAGIRR